jgi:molecular chaperone DnaK
MPAVRHGGDVPIARSPFATETQETPAGLFSGLRKLFGKR